MPAHGDQHKFIPNPFEEGPRHINEYTAVEIATLQSRLNKQLGPEYLSARPGAGGSKVYYVSGEKVINLANEVFGFNGWSTSIQNVQIDFCDELQGGKVSLGLSIIMRVTLKDGTYHEDIGYGQIENAKGKAAAFEKAKKEGATDALKRTLRNFGNVLGNCVYDKDYLNKVSKVKVNPSKWDAQDLHRHRKFAPVKKEPDPVQDKQENKIPARTTSVQSTASAGEYEDEFGGSGFFDGVDLNIGAKRDEVAPEATTIPNTSSNSSNTRTNIPPAELSRGLQANQNQQAPRVQPMSAIGQQNNAQERNHQVPQKPPMQQSAPPQTSHPANQYPRPQNVQRRMPPLELQPDQRSHQPLPQPSYRAAPPQTDNHPQQRPQQQQAQPPYRSVTPQVDNNLQQRLPQQQPQGAYRGAPAPRPTLNRPTNEPMSRDAAASPEKQVAPQNPPSEHTPQPSNHAAPAHEPPVGFMHARSAEQINKTDAAANNAPLPVKAFDPHIESPSLRRTNGVDHRRSAPIMRQTISGGGPSGPSTNQTPEPGALGANRPNFVNPQADLHRRIGVPGMAQSPLHNRNAYRPPGPAGTKRTSDGGRQALGDVSNLPLVGGDGPDAKRLKPTELLGRPVDESK
ncbi:hypothetical protein K402DRAFT_392359 [Aulographum hederae CBS 113979]|uniref:RAD52 homolog n=1 Tax=Aulographum hederae CBS 113979 TaxID=1176131 RepID=A0A6G1H4D6_9PEZI|nr:hypothetical protein K402DRAFT_392359 [Aulographum hederae CBS 113979]